MVVTSVAGHLMSLDFIEQYKPWHSCDPSALFSVPVMKTVPQVSLLTNIKK
jgi:DNA topoisomerase-3